MFTHPVVQDLVFIIESECIYQDFDLSAYWLPDVVSRLQQLNKNPEPILTLLEKSKSHFLGSYFEYLFSYAIHQLSELTIVFEHLQIIEDKKTLGEVDMVVKTPQGTVHQFELAIKFYLHIGSRGKHVNMPNSVSTTLLGPNKNDSFQKKYVRAKEHQLSILDAPAAQSVLDNYGIDEPVSRELLMFGYLYAQFIDPQSLMEELSVQKCDELDPLVNPASMQGWWIYLKDIMLLSDTWISARELAKLEWISGVDRVTNEGRNNAILTYFDSFHENIKQTFEQDERPRHFIITFFFMGEIIHKRFFIVPDSW